MSRLSSEPRRVETAILDLAWTPPRVGRRQIACEAIGALATQCLLREVETWPKPGLVSHIDAGSHADMDADMLRRSATVLQPFFTQIAAAGRNRAGMDAMRTIGLAAEDAMLAETQGVNTHRGAIFGLGLLCAAAGHRGDTAEPLGAIVRREWSAALHAGPIPLYSHGTEAFRNFGVVGARGEAIAGFPSVYAIGLPALCEGRRLAPNDEEAARVHAIFALIAEVDDTNLLHRGGRDGLGFAQRTAQAFLAVGGVGASKWRLAAAQAHEAFVARRLSPGGAADLLAFSLFVAALDP